VSYCSVGNIRHWYTMPGTIGERLDYCARCGAPGPGIRPLTPGFKRALQILSELSKRTRSSNPYGTVRPRDFALAMWPDAPGWNVHVNCGPKGVTKGRQMVMAGGALLGRLYKRKLVSYRWPPSSISRYYDGYVLSPHGIAALKGIRRGKK